MRRAGVLATLLLALSASPALAGELAYSAGAPSQVFTIGTHGGPARQITHDAAGAAHPDWSRDGRHVAYDVGGQRIAVANGDGSGEHLITIDTSAIDPSWSPDSSQLVFTGPEYDENGQPENTYLYVTQAGGSNYVRIGNGSEPDWSPAGNWIVYRSNPASSGGTAGIWRVRPDGSENDPVVASGSDPSVSADGKRVVYVSADGTAIYTTSIHGGRKHRVVRDASVKGSPVFSPSGRAIVYSTANGLWKVSVKGGRAKRIAGAGGFVAWQPR
jgi:Tol biopolymer transport system component